MAALDFVAVRADSTHVAFQELNLGRCRQEVLYRLLRFWDSCNIKRDNKFMGITMLFLDENVYNRFAYSDEHDRWIMYDYADKTFKLNVVIDVPGEEAYHFKSRLLGKRILEKCRYEVCQTKVEIRLAKAEIISGASLQYGKGQALLPKSNAASAVS